MDLFLLKINPLEAQEDLICDTQAQPFLFFRYIEQNSDPATINFYGINLRTTLN